MSEKLNAANESSLVRLYMSLTGTTQSAARGVLMHLCGKESEENSGTNEGVLKLWREKQPLPVSEPVQSLINTSIYGGEWRSRPGTNPFQGFSRATSF